jgi:hypothetical protein
MPKATAKPRGRNKTGGGKATTGGVTYQAQTLAWVAVHALARQPLPGSLTGTADATPVLMKHEGGAGVDDAYIELARIMHDGGRFGTPDRGRRSSGRLTWAV